uniref:Alpha/beta hydrolase fold-3 domain-containing protein n=1 Tax=Quercus lobata TaxID=97700 RepID=A0A7N2N6G6_QUELO
MNHDFCFNMALQLSAVVVSVEYRLAPEHRLPAAYDDAVEALHWIKCTQEKLLRDFADYSKCFLMGTSAGGNIAYQVGLHASTAIVLPLCSTDLIWKLALPIGVDRDHEYCNPTVGGGFDQIRELGWWVVVTGCDGDPLIDRQMELVEMLKKKGVKVEAQLNEGDHHGVELMDATKANALLRCCNVAYHAGLRVASEVENLQPLITIKGQILHQPFFSGNQRTESELRLVNDPVLPFFVNDLMWELSLPIGVDRDHEYCNPAVGGGSQRLEKIRLLEWRVLMIDCKGDPPIDHQIELVKMMEEKGLAVASQFDKGGHHGVDLQDLSRAKALQAVLKNFMLPSLVV